MVEEVKRFGAELQADAFDDGDRLDDREIDVVDLVGAVAGEGAGECAGVAVEHTRGAAFEARGVEGLVQVAGVPIQVAAEIDDVAPTDGRA